MVRWYCLVLISFFGITLLSCGGEDLAPEASQILNAARFESITSPSSFEFALIETGDAEGWGSAVFEMVYGRATYSEDCDPAFLLAHEFTVDSRYTLEEVRGQIEAGVGERSGELDLYYHNGRLWFLHGGPDGEDIRGAINQDGRFRIVTGEYPSEKNYRFIVYEGEINGEALEGQCSSMIRSSEKPSGTCSVSFPFRGRMSVVRTFSPDPPTK